MIFREEDKHFLASIYVAIAIIFTWKGLWEGIYELPYVGDPFVFLFIGLTMLTFSGLIFKEFDPLGSIEKRTKKIIHDVYNHPSKKSFTIKYLDKHSKKHITIDASHIKRIEKGTIIIVRSQQKEEQFIPLHRITEVLYNGASYWRK